MGRKNQPAYRIVVADSRKARDGSIVAMLGHYQPRNKGQQFDMDVEAVREWLAKGATPSETVLSLLKKAGCFATPVHAAPAPKEA